MGLTGGHSLAQNVGLLLKSLDKTGICRLQPAGLCVQIEAPPIGVDVNSGLGCGQLRLQLFLLLLEPGDLLEAPAPVQPAHQALVIVQNRNRRRGGGGRK